jgi:hypothetical protein
VNKYLFSVDWSEDGIAWQTKEFEKYDTAKHFFHEMYSKYSPNVRMYEI